MIMADLADIPPEVIEKYEKLFARQATIEAERWDLNRKLHRVSELPPEVEYRSFDEIEQKLFELNQQWILVEGKIQEIDRRYCPNGKEDL